MDSVSLLDKVHARAVLQHPNVSACDHFCRRISCFDFNRRPVVCRASGKRKFLYTDGWRGKLSTNLVFSSRGHWPFPREKLSQGYAYILTHPGTPVVFYDHFYDFGLHDMITELIEARTRAGINCRSSVKIYHANNGGYVAQIGDTLVMKLGYLDWNPFKEVALDGSWQKFVDKGSDYQLWMRQ